MNYTEEEFFGNRQNLNGGQEEISASNNEKIDMGGTILKTFFRTAVALIGLVFYAFAVVLVVSPKTSIRIYDFIGAEQASLVAYERVYLSSGTLADLYNLVQKSVETKNHEKTSRYIKELQAKSDYTEFCKKVNSAVHQVTDKKYVAYVGDLDGYLVSQNILALYNNGQKNEALSVALSDFDNDNIYSFGLASYLESVLNDKELSSEEKKSKLLEVNNMAITSGGAQKYVCSAVEERKVLVNVEQYTNEIDRLLKVYTSLKINNYKLKLCELTNDENAAVDIAAEINSLQNLYDSLINN